MPITSNQFISPLALSTLDGIIGTTLNGGAAYDASGNSATFAGDVNGDGIADMLVGASNASPGNLYAGSTYLIFGHTGLWDVSLDLSGLNGTNGVVINGIKTHDHTGYSVASAGDVNGDNFDDIIIGAYRVSPGNLTNIGSAYVIFGHGGTWTSPLTLSSLNGTNGVVINGIAANDYSGYSVASAGDVNGDGISDLLVGAPNASPGSLYQAGSAYLIFGHPGTWNNPLALSILNGTNGVVINGIAANDYSGYSVASAGDVNGDGISDLLIGAPSFYGAGSSAFSGSTYLIFGHAGNWNSPLALSALNGTNGVVISGIVTQGFSGCFVASAGDVNGDNVSDIMIGAYGVDPVGRLDAGSTYLIFGHAGNWNTPFQLANLNGINGVIINGVTANDRSGISVASAGDMNGDGLDDVMIGAYQASPEGLSGAGSAYLIFGHAGTWISPLALSTLNGTNGVVINGIAAGDYSGFSVASAGDVNGDGLSDMLIGASSASPKGLYQAGSTYLIFGDSLELLINTLIINQDQTIFLNDSMLAAIHPYNLAINASIPFIITKVMHGAFSTPSFVQNQLSQVSFTHDGSIYPPSYEVMAGNWAVVGPVVATISFDVPPILYLNSFSIGQGQTIVLTNQTILATSLYSSSDALLFNVSNVLYGNFVKTNTTIVENQFNQSALMEGRISFATDGTASSPSYDISVGNGRVTTAAAHGIVNFNAAPILLNNELTLTSGQQKVILSSSELSASDTATSSAELIFMPSTFNCHFENINLPGTTLPSFLQGNIQGGQILFVWDGHSTPAYNMSVSDRALWTGPAAALIRLNTPPINTFTTIESSNTVRNAIIGGTVSGIISLGFLLLRCYLGKRMNGALKNILVVENSTVEQEQEEWKRETLSLVVKEIFNKFKTTGFIGYRNEADTKAYVQAVELLLLEIKKQGVEVHFPKLSITERIRLLTAIVDEIKIQLVGPSSISNFIKPAFTAAELKVAVPAIAKVVAMTVQKEKAADRIRHTVVERPKESSYPVMVHDNEIELQAIGVEQKFVSEFAANQDLIIDQPSFETRMAKIEGHFAKSSAKFEEHSAKTELRLAKIESSLEELLGHQPGANQKCVATQPKNISKITVIKCRRLG